MAESGGLQGAGDMGRLVGEVGVAEGENSVAANTWITSEVRAISERRPGPGLLPSPTPGDAAARRERFMDQFGQPASTMT
jgi:hypothetical protein